MVNKRALYSSGKIIIQMADWIKYMISAPFILGGVIAIILFARAHSLVLGLIIGVVCIAIGIISGKIWSAILRGFGESVLYTAEIADFVETMRLSPSNSAESIPDDSWKCSCGRVNRNYISTCACGKSKRDVT